MKSAYTKILKLAKPFLITRDNDVHTRFCIRYAYKLLETENGNENVVIPAIILHDIGWIKIPEELHKKAFGPKSHSPELNRIHEVEGVNLSRDILEKVKYDNSYTKEILEIIDGHDSRKNSISTNDKIVKDSDKLWRFSKKGFYMNVKKFEETPKEAINRLGWQRDNLLFTESAKKIAKEEIKNRSKENKLSYVDTSVR
jgi:HD superfamily phosphodiesterase